MAIVCGKAWECLLTKLTQLEVSVESIQFEIAQAESQVQELKIQRVKYLASLADIREALAE